MTATTCHMSISLDGFVAGPSQSRENPLGVGGRQLHTWHLGEVSDEADLTAQSWLMRPRGAPPVPPTPGTNSFPPRPAPRGRTRGAGGGANTRRITPPSSS